MSPRIALYLLCIQYSEAMSTMVYYYLLPSLISTFLSEIGSEPICEPCSYDDRRGWFPESQPLLQSELGNVPAKLAFDICLTVSFLHYTCQHLVCFSEK